MCYTLHSPRCLLIIHFSLISYIETLQFIHYSMNQNSFPKFIVFRMMLTEHRQVFFFNFFSHPQTIIRIEAHLKYTIYIINFIGKIKIPDQ